MDRERVKEEVKFWLDDGTASRILYHYLKGLGINLINKEDADRFSKLELQFTDEVVDVISDILINNYSSLK